MPQNLWAYGYLAEFVGTDGSLRIEGDDVFASDLIVRPRWDSTPIALTVCAVGSAYNTAIISYSTAKADELVEDVQNAVNDWQNMPGTADHNLTFATVAKATTTDACNSAPNRIYFQNLGASGPIGFTSVNYKDNLVNDELIIESADIVINSNTFVVDYATGDCLDLISSTISCDPDAFTFSFRGILVHEIGHLLGLSHSIIYNEPTATSNVSFFEYIATMYPSVDGLLDSIAAETLHLDDKLGFLELYYPNAALPSGNTGVISGKVMRTPLKGQIGAHVLAFDATEKKLIAGAYTSISGNYGTPSGEYSIRGLPLNTDIVLIVEPVEQSFDGLDYERFSTPISVAQKNESKGYQTFKIEAYPDVTLAANVRANRNVSMGAAEVFNLTSENETRSGLVTYISKTVNAPNDAAATDLSFVVSADELILKLVSPVDLSTLSPTGLTLTALQDSESSDWSSAIPAFNYTGTEQQVSVDIKSLKLKTGDLHSLTATLSEPTYGPFVGTAEFEVSSPLGGTSGGGGCALTSEPTVKGLRLFSLVLIFAVILVAIRRGQRKSFTRVGGILSRPNAS